MTVCVHLWNLGCDTMKVTITPQKLQGTVPAIPSKSAAHRLLICAALADRQTVIRCDKTSADIDATADCLRAMGAEIARVGDDFHVTPILAAQKAKLDVGESGSTLRFLLPVLCALGQDAEVILHGRLPDRPMEPLWSLLQENGAVLQKPCREVIAVSGKLTGKDFTIAADVSSQYISGLLFALPLLGGGCVTLTGKVESEGYIRMTVQALEAFGIQADRQENVIRIKGSYRSPGTAMVEGDWSNAAFWLTADALCGNVTCTGLDENSCQGDKAVVQALNAIKNGNATLDASQIPDLVPILAVAAALTPGTTHITGAARLRLKESDRLQTVRQMLCDLGGSVTELADGLIVYGQASLKGGTTSACGDHRIAMAAAIASIGCAEPVVIEGAEAVNKSYPRFFSDFAMLGGQCKEEA